VAVAKRNLKDGETLDGMGGFTCYGVIDNYEICQAENLLPMALSQGCRLRRDILQDQPIAYTDVELPSGRLCDKLRAEQVTYFAPSKRSPGCSG
jgi:predicted homoserine dehydrogenase-like protein